MPRLRHQEFGSVHTLNESIAPLPTNLNSWQFQKLPGCPAGARAAADSVLRDRAFKDRDREIYAAAKTAV